MHSGMYSIVQHLQGTYCADKAESRPVQTHEARQSRDRRPAPSMQPADIIN